MVGDSQCDPPQGGVVGQVVAMPVELLAGQTAQDPVPGPRCQPAALADVEHLVDGQTRSLPQAGVVAGGVQGRGDSDQPHQCDSRQSEAEPT